MRGHYDVGLHHRVVDAVDHGIDPKGEEVLVVLSVDLEGGLATVA